jgi:hypothetical protein
LLQKRALYTIEGWTQQLQSPDFQKYRGKAKLPAC